MHEDYNLIDLQDLEMEEPSVSSDRRAIYNMIPPVYQGNLQVR